MADGLTRRGPGGGDPGLEQNIELAGFDRENATSERHNQWACMALDRIRVPCPRCCRCLRQYECQHPRPAFWNVA